MAPTLLLLLALLCGKAWMQAQQNVTVVLQQNAPTMSPNLAARLSCARYTDISGFPLIYVADDFVVPNLGLSNCTVLNFNVTGLRLRNDLSPYNITIQLLQHNTTGNKPYRLPFFSLTLCSPNGSCIWDPRTGIPIATYFSLKEGDVDDQGRVFSLSNVSFLPRDQTVWFAFYATLAQHFVYQSYVQNNMFWVPLNNNSGATQPEAFLYGQPNYHFKMRDVNNVLRYGFSEWTDATTVLLSIPIAGALPQMAFTVSLYCNTPGSSPPPTMPTTEPPTILASEETVQPTRTPSSESVSAAPTEAPTSNHSLIDGIWADPKISVPIVLIPVLFIFFCMACILLGYFRRNGKRRQTAPIELGDLEGRHEDNPSATGFDRYAIVGEMPTVPSTVVKSKWTDGMLMSTVSFSDDDDKQESTLDGTHDWMAKKDS